MNIYHIWRPDLHHYDEYSDAIVLAETEEEARNTHPNGAGVWPDYNWDTYYWPEPKNVRVELIGIAVEGMGPGVYCSSFHAG